MTTQLFQRAVFEQSLPLLASLPKPPREYREPMPRSLAICRALPGQEQLLGTCALEVGVSSTCAAEVQDQSSCTLVGHLRKKWLCIPSVAATC